MIYMLARTVATHSFFAFIAEKRCHQTVASVINFTSEKLAVNILVPCLMLISLVTLRTKSIVAKIVEAFSLAIVAVAKFATETTRHTARRTNYHPVLITYTAFANVDTFGFAEFFPTILAK
jgi:hypothetical protein